MLSQCFQSRRARTQTKNGRRPVHAARVRASPLALSLAVALSRVPTSLAPSAAALGHPTTIPDQKQAAIEARDEEEESDSDGDGGAAGAASPPRGPARRVRARRS